MEKIKAKIAEIEAFLEEKEIEYHYIDYDLKRGDNYEIQIVCDMVSNRILTLFEEKDIFPYVYPFAEIYIIMIIPFTI